MEHPGVADVSDVLVCLLTTSTPEGGGLLSGRVADFWGPEL
jgi:hypothetical protein